MKIECPKCTNIFNDKELVITQPIEKDDPKWYEASHKNGQIACPNCGIELKTSVLSWWPTLLLIPASAIFFLLHKSLATWVFPAICIGILILLKHTIRYEVKNL